MKKLLMKVAVWLMKFFIELTGQVVNTVMLCAIVAAIFTVFFKFWVFPEFVAEMERDRGICRPAVERSL